MHNGLHGIKITVNDGKSSLKKKTKKKKKDYSTRREEPNISRSGTAQCFAVFGL